MHAVLSVLSLCAGCLCSVAAQSPRDGDLRLVHRNPNLQSCGRVELYHNGSWGTVCDNSWHKRDADVVCRQLGYAKGSRFRCNAACFGEGEGKIWMDNLSCPHGGDRLMLCDYRGWGEHGCTHAEDAGVCCKGAATLPPLLQTSDTRVRISCPCAADDCTSCTTRLNSEAGACDSTSAAIEGMVAISFGDKWLPVSKEAWTATAAHVACGELGYPRAVEGSTGLPNDRCTAAEMVAMSRASRGSKHVVKSVECRGNESVLANCTLKTGPGSSSFSAAKLRCGFLMHPDCPNSNRTHRLRAGAVPWKGRVEVKKNEAWGTVYDNTFGLSEANVACRAAGFGSAIATQSGSEYGRGIGQVHYQNLQCSGDESSLSGCESASGSGLDHDRDVGVQCHRPSLCTAPLKMAPPGTDSNGSMVTGYLEYTGTEGPGLICAGELDIEAAKVACATTTEMFFHAMTPVAESAINTTVADGVFYRGSVQCTGEEADITECSVSLQSVTQCRGGLVQSITCTSCVPDMVPDLEAFRYSLQRHSSPSTSFSPAIVHYPMSHLTCALEEDCLSSSAQFAAITDTRMLLRFDSFTNNWGLCPFLPNLSRDQWIYHDCHDHYHSFEAFVDFNLIHPHTGEKVAEGHKASFCLEDTMCAEGYSRQYRCSRRASAQGISANCGDRYSRYLDCQWIDITGVESGVYHVSQSLNPHRDAVESDYRNNMVTCEIAIAVENSTLSVFDCWQSDHI